MSGDHNMNQTDSGWRKRQIALAQPEYRAVKTYHEGKPVYVAQQEPVALYVYKPTLPRGHLGNVSDGDLPWVYDQDPSSGYSARMLVYTSPPQRKPLTEFERMQIIGQEFPLPLVQSIVIQKIDSVCKAIEAAHNIKE